MEPHLDSPIASLISESVLDDFESLTQITATVKTWAAADGLPVEESEIPLLVAEMVRLGRINSYLFSKEENSFVLVKFDAQHQRDYWFKHA